MPPFMAASTEQTVPSVINSFTLPHTLMPMLWQPWGLCDRWVRVRSHRGACRSAPARPDTLDQAALTSIILGTAARGAGTLTSSMPFAYVASTWAASTPLGRVTLRWNAPYVTSRTK